MQVWADTRHHAEVWVDNLFDKILQLEKLLSWLAPVDTLQHQQHLSDLSGWVRHFGQGTCEKRERESV